MGQETFLNYWSNEGATQLEQCFVSLLNSRSQTSCWIASKQVVNFKYTNFLALKIINDSS